RRARLDHSRSDAAGAGRLPRAPRVTGRGAPDAHPHPHGARGRVRQGSRPASGGGRLRHKAVRRARAPGPSGSAVAAHRATGRRRRRARSVRRCGSHPRVPLRAAGWRLGHPRTVGVFSPMTDRHPPARYTVGLVQMAMSADPAANLKKAVAKVSEAAAAGARLVCLPELFRSQYFAQHEDPALFDLAEPVPGPSTEALGKVAKQAGVVVIVPVFERRAAGLYHNSAAVIDADGRMLGIYRKMHIPDDPAYYEKFYFTP